MKPCLICHAHCLNDAASCGGCGEGSFGPPSEGDDGAGEGPKVKVATKPKANKPGRGKTPSTPPSEGDDGAGEG